MTSPEIHLLLQIAGGFAAFSALFVAGVFLSDWNAERRFKARLRAMREARRIHS